ncbi:hypothetical protein [Streptomyces sp. NPDC050264]|uniref:hypothetical protein n=1 Tax=Streptomyces sp. NPDC050264 TaxID=3155038 RepID=UPI00342D5EBE
MRLGKALATGIAEEAPQDTEVREVTPPERELSAEVSVDELPEPVEVPAVR